MKDSIKISDNVSVTSWLSPRIFFEEYLKHKERYLKKEESKDLLLAYIFLQLYLENHFHYYLRFLIGGGMGKKIDKWNDEDSVFKRLKYFKQFLFENDFILDQAHFKIIENNFKYISDIRNLFLHGHPVTKTIKDNKEQISDAKRFLSRQEFNNTRKIANHLFNTWNGIILNIQKQDKLLNKSGLPSTSFLDECKFTLF